MIILDENIVAAQLAELRESKIRFNHIGTDIGRKGMQDRAEIVPLLHKSRRALFFTQDLGFFEREPCHRSYWIVCLDVSDREAAFYVRRVLRHPAFRTNKQRLGSVVLVRESSVTFWQVGNPARQRLGWPKK